MASSRVNWNLIFEESLEKGVLFLLTKPNCLVYYLINTLTRCEAEGAVGVDFEENKPIYKQIIHLVSLKLIQQEWQLGERIPSVRDMALQLRVNPNTVQRAYSEMERDGLIFSARGTGRFVTEDAKVIEELKAKITQEISQRFYLEMSHLGWTTEEIVGWVEKFHPGRENE